MGSSSIWHWITLAVSIGGLAALAWAVFHAAKWLIAALRINPKWPLRIAQAGAVLLLVGFGSCSLHSGLRARSYSTGEESLAVGAGAVFLAMALWLYDKWFRRQARG